jgi:hypothetical protein
MTDTRDRGKVDFQDVAKLATLPQTSTASADEKSENSGLIHLSALAAGEVAGPDGAGAPSKKPAPATPTQPRQHVVARTAQQDQRPVPGPAQQDLRPVPGPVQQDLRTVPRPQSTPLDSLGSSRMPATRFTTWIALAAGMALGGLMAGVLFATRASSSAETTRTGSTLSQSTQSASLPNGSTNTPGTPIATAAHGAGVEDHPVDPSALPAAPTSDQGRASASASTRQPAGATGPSQTSRSTPTTGTQVAAGGGSGPAAASASVPRPGTDDSLEALIKRSVTGSDHGSGGAQPGGGAIDTAPATPTAGLPAKPAMGAVQGAVGTVLPAARYCLGPDDPVSRATITFKSDGSVQNIAVSGNAAGQPAEGCIRSRLMSARVPPFASPTFTWTVTVRPAS